MLSRIPVPMDDSDQAGHTLEYALEDDINEAAAERAEPVFDRAHKIADEWVREIETIVGIGHLVRNIIDRADDYDAIMIGSHGADRERAVHRFLVGNVAEPVSKRVQIPATIVH